MASFMTPSPNTSEYSTPASSGRMTCAVHQSGPMTYAVISCALNSLPSSAGSQQAGAHQTSAVRWFGPRELAAVLQAVSN